MTMTCGNVQIMHTVHEKYAFEFCINCWPKTNSCRFVAKLHFSLLVKHTVSKPSGMDSCYTSKPQEFP